jgi:DNA polymerase III sliding clamp (beta) subunit (PCNA family)
MSKAIVDLKEFQAAVKRVSAVLNKKCCFVELRDLIKIGVDDGAFVLAATDTDITYNAFGKCDCDNSWHEYIHLAQLEPIVRNKSKAHLTIEDEKEFVVLRSESIVVRCKKHIKDDGDSFMAQKVFDKDYKRQVRIRDKEDCNVFKSSLSCVSKDESRPAFLGVAFQKYNLISTDSKRLYKGLLSTCDDDSFRGVINTKLVRAIAGGLTGQLYERKLKQDGTTYHVLIANNDDVIISRSVSKDDDFPDFSSVFPTKWEGNHAIDKHIYEVIKTYAAGFKNSRICFLKDKTVIKEMGNKLGNNERIFDRIEGMPIGLAVNTNFFLQAIEQFKDDLKYDKTIQFCWLNGDSPMWAGKELSKVWGEGTGSDYLNGNGTIIMPMMI